jgi:hypothetical protein
MLVIAGISSTSFNQTVNTKCIFSKEHFMTHRWYQHMLAELQKHDKVDSHAAYHIRVTSSNFRVTKETDAETKARTGKTENSDIRVICNFPEKPEIMYILTQAHGPYHFLFEYNINTGKLARIKNKDIAVMVHQKYMVGEHNERGFTLRNYSEYFDNCTYHQFDDAQKTFYRLKNCTIIEGKEHCEPAK